MITDKVNPAYPAFRLREEFLLYLKSLCTELNQSVWSIDDESLAVEHYFVEQKVITTIEKRREGDREDEQRFSEERENISARFYEQNPNEDRYELINWSRAIEQNKRLAIIGSPGSGKTFSTKATVIKKARDLHYKIASYSTTFDHPEEIPIWITAKSLADSTGENITDALIEILGKNLYEPRLSNGIFFKWLKPQMKAVFEKRGTPKRFFIVIDALDELTFDEKSKKKSERFKDLIKKMDVPGVHLVTTCRTLQWGSRQGWLGWNNPVKMELASLQRPQKLEFIEQFFDNPELRDSARKLLESNPAIDHATNNALLLTFVCFLHLDKQLKENSTYIDIYAKMQSQLFVGAWKEEEPFWVSCDEAEDYRINLERIAYEIFSKNPDSNSFTFERWNEAAKKCKLPKTKAIKFRKELVRIGFLVKAGVDDKGDENLSFLHRTLLEFLAAKSLAKQKDWLIEARKHFWHLAWTETLTFLAGLLNDDGIRQLIGAVRNEEREIREKYQGEIFGWLIYLEARFTGVSKLGGEEIERICDLIIYGLFDFSGYGEETNCHKPEERKQIIANHNIYEPLIKLSRSSLELNQSCKTYILRGRQWKVLLTLLKRSERFFTLCTLYEYDTLRRFAAEYLGKLGFVDEEIIQTLLVTLKKDWRIDVRRVAAESLGKLGFADEEVIQTLLTTLKEDQDLRVRFNAAESLGKLGFLDEEVIQTLLTTLKQDRSVKWRIDATKVMGELGAVNDKVVHALLKALKDNFILVQPYAAKALGQLVVKSRNQLGELLIEQIIKRISVRMDSSHYILDIGFSTPLFKVWQFLNTNKPFTWKMMDEIGNSES